MTSPIARIGFCFSVRCFHFNNLIKIKMLTCPRNWSYSFIYTPTTNLGPLVLTFMNFFSYASGYIGVPLAFAINRSFTCVMGVGQRTPQSGLTSPASTQNPQMPGLLSPEFIRNFCPRSIFCFLPTPNTNLGPLALTLMNFLQSASGYIGVPLADCKNVS